jgi:WD40 repeat protein
MNRLIGWIRRHQRRLALAACALVLFGLWFGLWLRVLPILPRATITLPPEYEVEDISADGRLLATVSRRPTAQAPDSGIRVYDLYSGGLKCHLHPESLHNAQPRFSPDGRWLFAAINPPGEEWWRVILYDLEQEKETLTLLRASPQYTSPFSPDSKYLVISRGDLGWELYATDSGKRIASLPGGRFAFSPDSRFVICHSSFDGTASIVRFGLDDHATTTLYRGEYAGTALSPDSTLLAVSVAATSDGGQTYHTEVTLVDLTTGKERKLPRHAGLASELVFSEDGQRLIGFEGGWPRLPPENFTIWDLRTGAAAATQLSSVNMQAEFHDRPWARPLIILNEFATGGGTGRSHVFDAVRADWCAQFAELQSFDVPGITLDGRFLAWPTLLEDGEPGFVAQLSRVFDSNKQARPGHDRALRLFELNTLRQVLLVPGVSEFRFSLDGRTMLTWNRDREVRVWDLPPCRPVLLLLLLSSVPTFLFTTLLWWRLGR